MRFQASAEMRGSEVIQCEKEAIVSRGRKRLLVLEKGSGMLKGKRVRKN